jgi:predicted transposase YbfD/YdcC
MAPVDVDGKTNEMLQVKDLFDPWDISGKVVTWDALHTQTETARYRVADKRAPYVREIQGNHPSLLDAMKTRGPEDFSRCAHDLGPGTRSVSWPIRATPMLSCPAHALS